MELTGIEPAIANHLWLTTSSLPYFVFVKCRNLFSEIIARIPAIRFAPTHTNIKIATP